MNIQSRLFFTKDVVIRKFTIIDLALAATPVELVNIIKGLYQLPAAQSKRTVLAVKNRFYLDFLFMPFACLSVFILCITVAGRVQLDWGKIVFIVFAWLQLVAWLCHVIENIYLLSKIRPNPAMPDVVAYKAYLKMETVKWGIVLIAAVCSVSAICYFWLAGHYSPASLHYILIVLAEIALFILFQFFLVKKKAPGENL